MATGEDDVDSRSIELSLVTAACGLYFPFLLRMSRSCVCFHVLVLLATRYQRNGFGWCMDCLEVHVLHEHDDEYAKALYVAYCTCEWQR